jgi:hypothetical protein
MDAIQFETELRGESTLTLPPDVLAKLPKSGRARIVLLIQGNSEDEDWRRASYEHFMRDDNGDDAVYDTYS